MPTKNFVVPCRQFTLAILLATFTTSSYALSYDEALRIAEVRATELQARQNSVAAAQSASLSAGELPDPKLLLAVNNLPLSGSDRFSLVGDSFTESKIGVMQEITNTGKREAARQLAQANIANANAGLQIERLVVRREAGLAWLRVYFVQQKRALLDELDAENLLLASSANARLAGGQGKASDALLPHQEAAALADRRDDLTRDLAKAQAALSRWIGNAASQRLSGEPPLLTLSEIQLQHTLERHPNLTIFNSMEDAAHADIAMAQAAKKSDWGVELAYQRRGPAFSDFVSVQFTFDLPIFSKTRQDPIIAARQQDMERVAAERETTLRQHTEELQGMLAERVALERQIERVDGEWLTLARQKLELATADYGAGQEPLMAVLEARKYLIDTRMKRIDLASRHAEVDVGVRYLTTENQP